MDHNVKIRLVWTLALVSLVRSIALPLWSTSGEPISQMPGVGYQKTSNDYCAYGIWSTVYLEHYGTPITKSSLIPIWSYSITDFLPFDVFLITSVLTFFIVLYEVRSIKTVSPNLQSRLKKLAWVALILNLATIVTFPVLFSIVKKQIWFGGNGLLYGSYEDNITFINSHYGLNIGYFLQFVALAFIVGAIWIMLRSQKSIQQEQ